MRVRFAPSPTGALHIGGARTALFNWLLARGNAGSLVLRIEDTDRERSTEENVAQILEALEWLGLDWDEGPVFQTQNEARHLEVLAQLEADGKAYRTTANADDVRAWKEEHGADLGFRGEPSDEGALRLRVPDEGETIVRDAIRGEAVFAHRHLDDPVIARADGTPLYNLAVAVDDLDRCAPRRAAIGRLAVVLIIIGPRNVRLEKHVDRVIDLVQQLKRLNVI